MSTIVTDIPRTASHRFDPEDEVTHRDSIGYESAVCVVDRQTWRVVLDGNNGIVVPTYTLIDVHGERLTDVTDDADLVSA